MLSVLQNEAAYKDMDWTIYPGILMAMVCCYGIVQTTLPTYFIAFLIFVGTLALLQAIVGIFAKKTLVLYDKCPTVLYGDRVRMIGIALMSLGVIFAIGSVCMWIHTVASGQSWLAKHWYMHLLIIIWSLHDIFLGNRLRLGK